MKLRRSSSSPLTFPSAAASTAPATSTASAQVPAQASATARTKNASPTTSRSARRSATWRISLAILLTFLPLLVLVLHLTLQPYPHLRPKIFIIGLSKTGTTSLGDALALLGYKRLGWRDVRSRHLVQSWHYGDHTPLVEQTRYYDAFEDLPWPYLYREMAALYPDARFVLSLRRDEATWLRSMRRHVDCSRWLGYEYFYGAGRVEGNEEVVLEAYRNHTGNVRAFFREQSHRYAEVTIEDDGEVNWAVLCQVAQCPRGRAPGVVGFPRSNTAAQWAKGKVFDALRKVWNASIRQVEELSTFWYYRRKEQTVRLVLEGCWRVISVVEQACSEIYYQMTMPRRRKWS